MKKRQAFFLAALLAVLAAPAAAQQTTEVYIPIGESPGVSDSDSVIGTIADIEYDDYTMTVSANGETHAVRMTSDTRYYIDRSDDKKQSETGDFDDCREGQRIEVYLDDEGDAIWIKIDAG